MSQPLSPQHPAVVLRSHYLHLRALLATAVVAVVGLTVAVVILATTAGGNTQARSSSAATSTSPGNTRYDGGPEEGTRGPHGHLLGTSPRDEGGAIKPLNRFEHGYPYLYNGGHDEGNALR